jgi:hypothetical protein
MHVWRCTCATIISCTSRCAAHTLPHPPLAAWRLRAILCNLCSGDNGQIQTGKRAQHRAANVHTKHSRTQANLPCQRSPTCNQQRHDVCNDVVPTHSNTPTGRTSAWRAMGTLNVSRPSEKKGPPSVRERFAGLAASAMATDKECCVAPAHSSTFGSDAAQRNLELGTWNQRLRTEEQVHISRPNIQTTAYE